MKLSFRLKTLRLFLFLTFLTLGILVMANYIFMRHFRRWDLTQSQSFAIHSATRDILANLDDIVTVRVFFSRELPPNLLAVRQYVGDLLQEFASYANGDLQVQFLDPARDEVAEHAKELGIPAIRMNILSKDKFEIQNGFLGIAVLYGNQHQVLPVVESTANLEYDLISAIRKLTKAELKRVGFTVGHNEYPIIARSGMSGGEGHVLANAELTKDYLVQSVDLNNSEVLNDLSTLIIGGPEIPFSLREQVLLDQFLMRGGDLVFLLDGVKVEDFSHAAPLDVNLGNLLESYGVRVEPTLVLDQLNETASFAETALEFTAPYPFWVKSVKEYFDSHNPILSNLEAVVLPWVSPLTLIPQEGVNATVLIQSSPGAWTAEDLLNLSPDAEPPAITQQYPMAVLLEGTFKSFYAGQKRLPEDFMTASNGRGRVIVIGNSRFLTDRMVRQYKQNLTFFLNTIDYLTLDEQLISVRSSGVTSRPLIRLSDVERQGVKWGGIFLMPVLLLLYGITRYFERKKKIIKF
ncbi:MAG: GldG family protein [Candidatus Peregrinibacteria bacterium]